MNQLFGTQFPLHSNSKYSKGIFISYINDHKCLLIDNEGLDSSYRNEENKAYYDYVSSILCFLLCDIIIINILYTDIGRYSASCYDIINLFYQQILAAKNKASFNKKQIIYVIRDFDKNRHKNDMITRTIKDDLSALWFNMNKKNYFSYEDYLVLDIITISSFIYQRKEYNNEIEQLKEKILSNCFINNFPCISICNNDSQCNSFKEGLSKIVTNIKSHYSFYQLHPRNLMIFYNSLNNKEQINAQFKQYLKQFYYKSFKLLPNFKLEALELRIMILKSFDAKSIIYNEKMCYKVRKHLDEEISHSLYRAFMCQIQASTLDAQKNMRKTILSLYEKLELKDYFPVFDTVIKEAMNAYIVSLIEKKVYDKKWIFRIENPESIFTENYHLISKLYLILYEKLIITKLSNSINEIYLQVVSNYDQIKEVFWNKINEEYQSTVSDCLKVEEEHIRNLNRYPEESIQLFISMIKEKSDGIAKECYISFLKHNVSTIAVKLFENKMLYDDSNCSCIRQLNQFDDYEIDSLSWKYASFYLTLFDTMRYFKLESISNKREYQFNILSSFNKSYTEIITKDKLIQLKSSFNRQANNITHEIKHISHDTKAVVPLWLWVLLVLFGRNHIMYILTTKCLIVFLLFFGTYIILTQMRLMFIFRSNYYSFESKVRNSLYDKFHWKKPKTN